MNGSMKYLLSLAAISLAVCSTAAHAVELTFVAGGFNPVLTAGNDNAAMVSYWQDYLILPGDTPSPATTTAGQFDESLYQGNPAPGLASGGVIGDPVSSFTISDKGQRFTIQSFDLDPVTNPVVWSIYSGSTLLNQGTDSTIGSYSTIAPGVIGDYTSLTLQFSDFGSTSLYYVDNVNVAPEPSSLILAGSGLLGVAASRRRRVAV
jgi:hypothetical protein